MLVIIDYGMGNLRSFKYKLDLAKIESIISSRPEDIKQAGKLLLPGVGHFAEAMKNLHQRNLIDVLNSQVIAAKVPILGICLGIQLFTNFSEEGNCPGLGWINAVTRKFDFAHLPETLSVPNIGWRRISPKKTGPLLEHVADSQRFYFVHSYHLICGDMQDILATCDYGYEFVAAIQHENIFGVQFHPEKSHKSGFEIIKDFASL